MWKHGRAMTADRSRRARTSTRRDGVITPCPVCLIAVEVVNDVVFEHLDTAGNICPMSGESAPIWDEKSTRESVKGRSNGVCEYCDGRRATDMHHRMARSVGGRWHPSNIMHLCRQCHMWITEPDRRDGDIVEMSGLTLRSDALPERIPVRRKNGMVVWLTDAIAPPR